LQDEDITEHIRPVGDRTTCFASTYSKQRIYDPPVDPNLAKQRRHGFKIIAPGRLQNGRHDQSCSRWEHSARLPDSFNRSCPRTFDATNAVVNMGRSGVEGYCDLVRRKRF
jgi:hypothetical protein